MIKQSDAFNAAFASTQRTLAIKLTVGDREFTADDLISVTYDSAAMTGEQMGLGTTYEDSLKIAFSDLVEGIQAKDKVTAAIGIQLPDKSYEYAPLGVFYVDGDISMDRNNKLTTISAVDTMCWLEGVYVPKVTVPTTLADMALDIANQAGVPINQDSFGRLPNIPITTLPSGQTYRVVLGLLAMLVPGYVVFDRSGQLCLRGLNQSQYDIGPDNYEMNGLTKNENPYAIAGITVTPLTETNNYSATDTTTEDETAEEATANDTASKSLHVGATTGTQLTLQNDFISESILKNMWSVLNEMQYYPYTLNWAGNPAVEAGDWLIVADTAGHNFIVPNNSYSLTFEGGLSAVSSTGETVTSPTNWDYHGQLMQTIKGIVRQLNSTGTFTYNTPTQPATPHEGDLWYKPNGTATELYMYSKGQWIPLASDITGDEISKKVDAAQKDIVAARNVADAANALAGTKVGEDEYNSKITQLSNDINLRVTSGDVINQINMEAGQTLIQSGKILLDAPSVVFSGSAFIPGAAIKNLSADKITAGTLDANVINLVNMNAGSISSGTLDANAVNLVNLNAGSITAGILSGKNLSLNLETGEVNFQDGNIYNLSKSFNINVSQGTIESIGSNLGKMTLNDGGISYRTHQEDETPSAQIGVGKTEGHVIEDITVPHLMLQTTGILDLVTVDNLLSQDKLAVSAVDMTGISISSSQITIKTASVDPTTSGVYITTGETMIGGNFTVVGKKNAVQVTRDGVRETPAYEMAESYLGDMGEAVTDTVGQVIVPIELLFSDVVNTTVPYQVFLQSYSSGNVWIGKRCESYFIVKSDRPNVSFVWQIMGKRRGYENDRLDRSKLSVDEIAKIEGYKS
ncbi:MAG TPA: gp58-like family protein [Candidatus Levilactobacillus faecigallinarum]|uniref:Gp58-like family protein n=1 Tax=Candidatus Levilactobacillus faecigallinarum TaxID=2838638 RepID=A0A9D1U3U7_9LACO|nr:gp58-like family protein [Candidatus Levilactobacillus faecigallinarum]